MKPRIAVVTFPGSNDDRDACRALRLVGAEPVPVWHADERLPDVGAVVLPGGFSYGDYLRAGAIARFAPAMRSVVELAERGGLVLGICNGFQVLCEAGLLPGALRRNASLEFVCTDVDVVVERSDTPFTAACSPGDVLTIPVKHGEGCWYASAEVRDEVEANGQVVLRYASGHNPNGSVGDVAGLVNEAGNVIGLMPHPEHAVDPLLGPTGGLAILGSVVRVAAGAALAV